MFCVDRQLDAEIRADCLRVVDTLPDQIRRGDGFSTNEEGEPDVAAEPEGQNDQNSEDEVPQAARLHRCSGRSLFWCSALYSASSYLRSRVRMTKSGMRASF